MKLATFVAPDGTRRIGALTADGRRLADLTASDADPAFADMLALIDAGADGLARARTLAADPRAVHDLAAVKLLAPIPVPRRMRDCLCFEKHFRQSKANRWLFGQGTARLDPATVDIPKVWYARPLYYKGNPFSVVGTDAEVHWPKYSQTIDYELELAVVMGKSGVDIPVERALEHAFGFTIFNDFSARDAQYIEMAAGLGPGKGKDFDTGNAMGPCIVTRDEIADPYALAMRVSVNGRVRSETVSGGMQHDIARCIAFVSQSETLHPGEVLAMGTVGNGCGYESLTFLDDGDVVEIEVEGIGRLRNRLVKAPGNTQ